MTGALVAATSSKSLWYLTRGTGAVTLLLLTASLVLGIVASVGWGNERLPRFVTQGLHRNISLLVMVFLLLHIATTVIDGFAPIGWLDAIVPFRSPYRPVWLGLGAVAVDVLLAVTITSLVRVRLGFRAWKAVHWLSYASWPVAIVHGLGTGSDTNTVWMLGLTAGCAALGMAAVWWRLALLWDQRTPVAIGAAALSVAVPAVVVGWLVVGPLRPGWAHASGTTISATAAAPATTPVVTGAASDPGSAIANGFTASFSGTMTTAPGATSTQVTITLTAPLQRPMATLLVQLRGRPSQGGGVSLSSGTVSLGPAAEPGQWTGPVTGLRGGNIGATVTDGAGHQLSVSINLSINQTRTAMHGTVVARSLQSGAS